VVLPIAAVSPAMDVMAVAAALAARGHGVAALVPAPDLAFAQRAAGRHSGGGGAAAIRWLTFESEMAVGAGGCG
jgi:hypothetical protein